MVYGMRRQGASLGILLICAGALGATDVRAQGLGGAGTLQGIVKDPTGGVMQSVDGRISNAVSGFTRTSTTDMLGHFVFSNLPPNPYHISIEAQGFQTLERDVDVRSAVPIALDLTATVPRYYWSEDLGYALWLRLAHDHAPIGLDPGA